MRISDWSSDVCSPDRPNNYRICELRPLVLEAINLECTRGKRRLFHGLSFELEAGASLFVRGQNGSGKTSLLRILAGLTPPSAGTVGWKGNSLQKQTDEWRRDLCYYGHKIGRAHVYTPVTTANIVCRIQ